MNLRFNVGEKIVCPNCMTVQAIANREIYSDYIMRMADWHWMAGDNPEHEKPNCFVCGTRYLKIVGVGKKLIYSQRGWI